MQAMLLENHAPIESSPLKLKQLPTPQPGSKQVRIKIHCCAICRTDLHVIEGDLPQAQLPIIPGHQIVGRVDAVGEGCNRLKLGERVGVAWLRYTCGRCQYCHTKRENLCEQARFTGYHEPGGYAEHTTVDEAFVYRIPESFSDVAATPLLCAGIIGYRALARSQLPLQGKLAIFGFGSSAHMVIQLAKHRGCEVYVITRGESHRQLAEKMGATWVGANTEDFPTKVHSAIIFAPAGELIPTALAILDKGGTLAVAGIHMTSIPPLDYTRHLFYERDLRSVTANTRDDGMALFEAAAAIPIRAQTTTYKLAEANQALQDLKADRINGTGVLQVC